MAFFYVKNLLVVPDCSFLTAICPFLHGLSEKIVLNYSENSNNSKFFYFLWFGADGAEKDWAV